MNCNYNRKPTPLTNGKAAAWRWALTRANRAPVRSDRARGVEAELAPKSSPNLTTKHTKDTKKSPETSPGVSDILYRTGSGPLIVVPSCSQCLRGEFSHPPASYAMIRLAFCSLRSAGNTVSRCLRGEGMGDAVPGRLGGSPSTASTMFLNHQVASSRFWPASPTRSGLRQVLLLAKPKHHPSNSLGKP